MKAFCYILYIMATENASYIAARNFYSEWVDDAPERVQAAICYELLRTGREETPEHFFNRLLKEVSSEN